MYESSDSFLSIYELTVYPRFQSASSLAVSSTYMSLVEVQSLLLDVISDCMLVSVYSALLLVGAVLRISVRVAAAKNDSCTWLRKKGPGLTSLSICIGTDELGSIRLNGDSKLNACA